MLRCIIFSVFLFCVTVLACDDCSCPTPIVVCKNVCDICDCKKATIDCSSSKLNASLPNNADYWQLGQRNPSMLLLDHNKIGRVVPFVKLNISSLSISYNMLTKIDPKAFINLEKLETLDLSYNQLRVDSLLPNVFEGPYNAVDFEPLPVTSLDLSYNVMNSLHPDVFQHLPFLERLVLKFNDFSPYLDSNAIVAICSVTKLKVLDLSATGLTSLPRTFLKNLPDLRELNLESNMLKKLPSFELKFAESLVNLHLNENPIEGFYDEDPFPVLPNLQQLHISFMPQLTRIEEGAFSGLSSLTYLDCKSNENLEFISALALNTSQLVRLDLQDNKLRYIPEGLIPNWAEVRVDIRGNQLSCDCRNQWILTTLMEHLENRGDALICKSPAPMAGALFQQLYKDKYEMRCLDFLGNHPERDATFLVSGFIILIIAMSITGVYIWYRRSGRFRQGRPVDYTAIYQQHVREEDKY